MKEIRYSRHYIDSNDINEVIKVLKSDYLTQGPTVNKFEKKISQFCGSKYAVTANSATSALHIACLAIGLKKNDRVWTSPNTFVASANCALYAGCKVHLIDIDLLTCNISLSLLKKKLVDAKKKLQLPKVLITVHFAGNVDNQKEIWALSKKYNFKIIEDASHSLGSSFQKNRVGNCKWSHITVFSFHPVKTITTIEGGCAMTNSKILSQKMNLYKNHGIEKKYHKFKYKNSSPLYYEQQELGYNYRLSDVSAALGISQLLKIDLFVKKRNLIAKNYINKLKYLPIEFQKIHHKTISSYHLIIIKLKTEKIRNKLFNFLDKKGIKLNIHYIPLFMHPFHKFKKLKNSLEHYNRSLSLPAYYSLTTKKQNFIISNIKRFFNEK